MKEHISAGEDPKSAVDHMLQVIAVVVRAIYDSTAKMSQHLGKRPLTEMFFFFFNG